MSGYKAAIDLIHNNTTKEMSDLANAFAANYFGKEYAVSFDSFLAGYKAAQQWISVKDRLPKEGQDVLVWYHNSYNVAYLQKVKPVKLQPPQFNNVEMFEWCFYDFEDVDVTYWQPLPEAPKEEK